MMQQGGSRWQTESPAPDQPLVSIIIVTFNAAAYLQQAIDSIQQQPFKNVELLVFDGASKDNTVTILQQNDAAIAYWQSEPDTGIYNAMNKAVKKTTGKWILFLGADDTVLEGFSQMISFLKDEQCIYYGDFIINGDRCGGQFNAYRFAKSNLCQQNVFYPAMVFQKYQYQEQYKISADHYLNLQCWADETIRFQYHSLPIANFASTGISSTQTDEVLEADREKLIQQFLGEKILRRYRLRQWKLKLKQFFKRK